MPAPTAARTPAHFNHWPPALPQHLTVPETHLFHNAEVSAARYPDKPFIVFYDSAITFREFRDECERIAGCLQHECGVKAGDRVLLCMQNSPQWILAFYGILRANAVVVPVNPMNRTDALRHCVRDTGATVAFVPQDLCEQMLPLIGDDSRDATGTDSGLRQLIVATYSDFLRQPTNLNVPSFVAEPIRRFDVAGVVAWRDMLARDLAPGPLTQGADDLAVMPNTSGTTGHPKGCMHTHRSVMSTLVGGTLWFQRTQDSVFLTVLPLFHVTGLAGSMNGPLYAGGTIVVLPRWDRDTAARCVERYRVNTFQFDVDARVVDPATLQEVAPGESGEIIVAGPQVMRGYWNDAAATAAAFVEVDGKTFLRTGDLAQGAVARTAGAGKGF